MDWNIVGNQNVEKSTWDLRDPSIHPTRLVCGTIFSHKGQGSVVDFASFILIVSKVTLCNLTMAGSDYSYT